MQENHRVGPCYDIHDDVRRESGQLGVYNSLEQPERPTMPVIPKAVAIAIFREGVEYGANNVCDELEGQTIYVEEKRVLGDFEVSSRKDIDLDDYLDPTTCVARPLTTATKSGL